MSNRFKDEDVVSTYPVGSWVYLLKTRQLGMVDGIRDTADGWAVRVRHIGLVPVDELRKATVAEIDRCFRR